MVKPATKAKAKPKAQPKVKPADQMLTQIEMADVLQISSRFLRKLQSDGIIETDKGKFHLAKTVRAYADHLKNGSEKKTGSASMDTLRDEKALEIRMNRARRERELIPLELADTILQEIVGDFNAHLSGLPAEITGVPAERHRLNDIIDRGRLRLADRQLKRLQALRDGSSAADAEAAD